MPSTTAAPPQSTLHTVESSPATSSSSSRLMPNLSRVSMSTSHPTLLPSQPESEPSTYAGRTFRFVSNSGKSVLRRSGLSGVFGQPAQPGPSAAKGYSTLDVSSILYATSQLHPEPASYPILVLSLSDIINISPLITNDELFDVLLRRLEPWVGEEGQGGYILVVFAADDKAKSTERTWPSLAWWVWRWKRIPRKYRKNMKRLYIIHPSLFTKTLLPFVLPLVSPKSYPKLHPLPLLLSLARDYGVSLSGVSIPMSVLHEEARWMKCRPDLRLERSSYPLPGEKEVDTESWSGTISSTFTYATSYLPFLRSQADIPDVDAGSHNNGLWGRRIEDIMDESAGQIPAALTDLGQAITKHCTQTEGIFRRSSNSTLLSPIIALLDLPVLDRPDLPWTAIAEEDPLLPPKVLLRFLSSLKEPFLPPSTYPQIRNILTFENLRTTFIPSLSTYRRIILAFLMELMREVATHQSSTRMTPMALAIVLAPSLILGPDPIEDAELCTLPGKKLPAGLRREKEHGEDAKDRGGTLVGVLEMWIQRDPWGTTESDAHET